MSHNIYFLYICELAPFRRKRGNKEKNMPKEQKTTDNILIF